MLGRIAIGIILFVSISIMSVPYYAQQAHPSKFSGGRPAGIILSEAGTTVFQVTFEDRKFNITLTGEGIIALEFSKEEKSIILENNRTEGTIEVEIPKELLDGEFTVMADGNEIDYELSETETESVLLFEKPADSKTITIQGTTVVPEFSVVIIVLASIVAFSLMITRAKINFNDKKYHC